MSSLIITLVRYSTLRKHATTLTLPVLRCKCTCRSTMNHNPCSSSTIGHPHCKHATTMALPVTERDLWRPRRTSGRHTGFIDRTDRSYDVKPRWADHEQPTPSLSQNPFFEVNPSTLPHSHPDPGGGSAEVGGGHQDGGGGERSEAIVEALLSQLQGSLHEGGGDPIAWHSCILQKKLT